MAETKIDEKYSVHHEHGTNLRATRYGEPWRKLEGDGLVLAMAHEIDALRERLQEVHGWAVCAPLSRPADMMQNISRIVEVTGPEYQHGR